MSRHTKAGRKRSFRRHVTHMLYVPLAGDLTAAKALLDEAYDALFHHGGRAFFAIPHDLRAP